MSVTTISTVVTTKPTVCKYDSSSPDYVLHHAAVLRTILAILSHWPVRILTQQSSLHHDSSGELDIIPQEPLTLLYSAIFGTSVYCVTVTLLRAVNESINSSYDC